MCLYGKTHPQIISLQDIVYKQDETQDNFFTVSLVMPLMQGDLNDLLQSMVSISIDHCKLFLYQILRALKYLHSAGVFHRDLVCRAKLLLTSRNLKMC